MKKVLLIIILVITKQAYSQKIKNVDTLNFEKINTAVDTNGLLNTMSIYKITHYPPYNEKRYELSKLLVSEIDFINSFYNNSLFYELKNSIANLKTTFPNLNLTTYENSVNQFLEKKKQKEIQEIYNDSLNKVIMKEAGLASDIKKRKDADDLYKMRMYDDSIQQVNKDKENAIEAENVRLQNFVYRNECIKKFGKVKGEKISQGQIALGDTKQMVEFAWGSADRISNSISNNASIEIWYFKKYNTFLSFRKGVLFNYVK